MTALYDFLVPFYLWIKAFHIMAVIAWMAGMLYLPRLFVYHCEVAPGSSEDERFKRMERRLLKIIINPSMGMTWIFGLLLVFLGGYWAEGWMHAKFALVLGMSALHGLFTRWCKDFARGANPRSQRFYRLMNEVPAVLIFVIVILVVVKPF